MAVIRNLVLAASALAPIVAAIPMVGQAKRDIITNTVTEVVWTIVEETTTVWIDPAASTPPPQAPVPAVTTTTTTSTSPIVAQVTSTPSTLATVAAAAPAEAYTVPPQAPAAQPTTTTTTTTTPSPAPAPAATTSAVNIQSKGTASVANGQCTGESDACSGDVTHWDGGKFFRLTLINVSRPMPKYLKPN
jgi:hypothetical protein